MERGDKFDREIEFFVEDCIHCGIHFAIPSNFLERRRKDHKTFYCPNGHGQCYTKETDAERWKKLFEEEAMKNRPVQEQKEEINRLKAQLNAYKGVVTRLKRKKESK